MRSATIKIVMTLSLWGSPVWGADEERDEETTYPSSLYTCNSIKVAFEQILRHAERVPGKSLALSIDFDNTMILNQERLTRHFNVASQYDWDEQSILDIAVFNAATNLSNSYIIGEAEPLWNKLQARYKNKFTSSQWPVFLRSAVEKGIAVFINTARQSTENARLKVANILKENTLISLFESESNNSLLSKMPKGPLPNFEHNYQHNAPPPPYFDKRNILYTSGRPKGPVLESYLTSGELNFDVIFHLDDNERQANSMFYTFATKTQIHCFHYLPQKMTLFSTIEEVNNYINKELAKFIPDYACTNKDWTIPRTQRIFFSRPYGSGL